MTALISSWLKSLFVQNAASNCASDGDGNTNSATRMSPQAPCLNIDRKRLLGESVSDRCLIVDRPSAMSDVDAMQCAAGAGDSNGNSQMKSPRETRLAKKDTVVMDTFQACFIDCTCQCEVRRFTCDSRSRRREVSSRSARRKRSSLRGVPIDVTAIELNWSKNCLINYVARPIRSSAIVNVDARG